jgi:hypothetical protein
LLEKNLCLAKINYRLQKLSETFRAPSLSSTQPNLDCIQLVPSQHPPTSLHI